MSDCLQDGCSTVRRDWTEMEEEFCPGTLNGVEMMEWIPFRLSWLAGYGRRVVCDDLLVAGSCVSPGLAWLLCPVVEVQATMCCMWIVVGDMRTAKCCVDLAALMDTQRADYFLGYQKMVMDGCGDVT